MHNYETKPLILVVDNLISLQTDITKHLVDLDVYMIYLKSLLKSALDNGDGDMAVFLNDIITAYIDQVDELGIILDKSTEF
jgi:hypothetical protein